VDRIVEMARDMLGADAASLNFIDHDRQWSKASAGFDGAEMPRDEAICNTTIQTPGVYVVEDLDAHPAFRDSTWAAGVDHVRFYAGYPLEAPGGERVGALCVMNRSPRHFTSDETATLRDLALRAQAVLWEQAG
jgi:GAF domain-containing protein